MVVRLMLATLSRLLHGTKHPAPISLTHLYPVRSRGGEKISLYGQRSLRSGCRPQNVALPIKEAHFRRRSSRW